ncbi:methyltransferase family protein [Pseudoalteromonas pernae]|uniref:methyltransferase family protein n=1 Tax=Pseudoalteromonas pernae TaxID=3118054 RepID=UPI003242D9A5
MLTLRVPPLLVVLIVLWVMFFTAFKVPDAHITVPLRELISSALALLGGVCALVAVVQFRLAQTTVDPRIPEQSSHLVTHGLYRYSRNPMYVGFLLMLFGWGVFLGNYVALIWLPVFVLYLNQHQIKPEEKVLQEIFKDEYVKYCTKVRRWI